MLSKTKMSILLGLTCVSLVGTGFSSWSIRVLKADQLGVITVGGDIVHLDWLSYNVDEDTCGISFVYSKNNGVKRFEKQYFDFNLIIDKNQFLADISTPELLNTAKLDCDFALTDSRFYIEKVDFHLPSSGLSYIVNNSAQTQLFTFTSLINDPLKNPNIYSFISAASTSVIISTRIYVNLKAGITDYTEINTGLVFAISGGA